MSEYDFNCPECDAPALDIDMKCRECGTSLASTGARRMLGQLVMGEYEIQEVIGQGGMAVVYGGRHRVTGQKVALKVLPPELARDRHIQTRFVEEARALAKLDHPSVVHLYNFGRDKDCFVLVMQLVSGDTWERLIFAGDIDWRRTASIAIEVLSALEYAHGQGIVHRDMKPSNVLIRSDDGAAMVMDFGIAKGERSAKLTDTGQTMGTVRYMSPEQVRGKSVDARSDLYSLGVALFESLTGQTPFDGGTAFDIMNAHLTSLPAPVLDHNPDVPRALSDLVGWMLAKRPEDRPFDAAAVRAALTEILEGERPAIPEQRAPAETAPIIGERRFPVATAVATAAIAVGALAAFFLLDPEGSEPEPRPAAIDAAAAGALQRPEVTVAAPPDAAATTIPEGFEVAVELGYPEDRLRILAAPGVDTSGIRREYREGVARWRRHLAGSAGGDGLDGEMPAVTLLVGSSDLVCDRAGFAVEDAWQECLKYGSYREQERTLRIPVSVEDRELAIHSAVPLAFCKAHESERCEGAANSYLARIFSQ